MGSLPAVQNVWSPWWVNKGERPFGDSEMRISENLERGVVCLGSWLALFIIGRCCHSLVWLCGITRPMRRAALCASQV